MIELGAPAWLAGLGLVPLIRVLHQFHGPGRVQIVPAAFLWPQGAAAGTTGLRRAPPDPSWRRRAMIAVLLALTLADPSWPTGEPPTLEVLVDNRPSLLAREADGSRRADQAALALRRALGPRRPAQARLIPVQGAWSEDALALNLDLIVDLNDAPTMAAALARLVDAGAAADATETVVGGAVRAPRWLVSDGSGGTERLTEFGPFEHVLPVGATTENQGIIRLAARPPLEPFGLLEVLVTLANPGWQPGERTLSLTLDSRTLVQTPIRIPTGTPITLTWQLPWNVADDTSSRAPDQAAPALAAALGPADALAADDRMTLDLHPLLPVPVVLPADCPRTVAAAVNAHPGLRPRVTTDPMDTETLRLWCRPLAPPADAATALWFPPGTPTPADGPARWLPPAAAGPTLRRLRPVAVQPTPSGTVLLTAGTAPLIIEQSSPRRLIGLFDTTPDDGPGGDPPAVPLLLDWMSARVLGRELLDPAVVTERPPAAVRIAPGPLPDAAPSPTPDVALQPRVPLWSLPLIGAILLLGHDLRRDPRTRAHPGRRRRSYAPSAGTPTPAQQPT